MSKASIIKVVIGALAVGLLAYFYITADRTPEYNWNTNYRADSKEPYGTYLFHELLKEGRSEDNFIMMNGPLRTILDDPEIVDANYFFIGDNWFYDEEDLAILSDFVGRGNQAYILSDVPPYELINSTEVISSIYFGSFRQSSVKMELNNSNQSSEPISLDFIFQWKPRSFNWSYADSISHPQIESLGQLNPTQYNYFKITHGSGKIYFHLTPIVFTNFHLREEDKLAYANEVFSQLNGGEVYWDNFSFLPTQDGESTQSPLSFILSQQSLRWAWYILLATALIYLVIYTKRKQRVIPVLASTRNTSLEFVKTIGGMYYHQQAHLKIVRQQLQLFLTYIRTHYGIATNKIDEDFLRKVSLKSNVKQEEISFILQEAERLKKLGNVTTQDLVDYNELTEAFYRNCK